MNNPSLVLVIFIVVRILLIRMVVGIVFFLCLIIVSVPMARLYHLE